jgi:fructose-1,6-bisphosphatase
LWICSGDAGTVNVQGEDVKKMDVFANNQLDRCFKAWH